jgi:midasin
VNFSLSMIASSSANQCNNTIEDGSKKHESEEEREERELREYFPDHSAEFQRIITRLDEDEDYQDDVDHLDDTDHSAAVQGSQLSDHELSLAVRLHHELFSRKAKADDKLRMRAFVTSYDAASRMAELTNWMVNPLDESSLLGSHIFALALRCNTSRNVWLPSLHSELIRDFHNDPFPSESIKADSPLRDLLIRIAQLLRAFPGHSILVGLGQVVERIRQLDIQVESLGRVMAGLEVILRRAQDWEQHASQHVQLGKPLKDISALVTTWRKLELHSWSSLLLMREKRRGIRANRHWPRMYSLIHNDRSENSEYTGGSNLLSNIPALSPKWVWKGFSQMSDRLGIDSNTKSIDELAQVLDTFMLTSNLAECTERLALIKSFANELRHECCVNGLRRLPLARLMHSLWNYYERLMPIIMNRKDKQREPIEKRLKDEVKLAKWDEQTYYSLVSADHETTI